MHKKVKAIYKTYLEGDFKDIRAELQKDITNVTCMKITGRMYVVCNSVVHSFYLSSRVPYLQ